MKKKDEGVAHVLSSKFADGDLVDRIFEYIVEQLPELRDKAVDVKFAVRAEFAGEKVWVSTKPLVARQRKELAVRVLAIFNGRNVSEVARTLDISRATVYRLLRQAGRE